MFALPPFEAWSVAMAFAHILCPKSQQYRRLMKQTVDIRTFYILQKLVEEYDERSHLANVVVDAVRVDRPNVFIPISVG